MMRRESAHRATAWVLAAGLIVLSGCSQDDPSGPSAGLQRQSGSAAVVEPSFWIPVDLQPENPSDPNPMVFLLPDACDVFLGSDPAEPVTPYQTFQVFYNPPPAGATVKLENDSHCDARDPTDASLAVVDPRTLHAAKGNGPVIHYSDLTFDLNGHSITSDGRIAGLALPPDIPAGTVLDNLGIVVTGSNVRIINSSSTPSQVTKFAHNIDVGGGNVVVDGGYTDNAPAGIGPEDDFGIHTDGGIGSDRAGNLTWKGVKSVGLDPIIGVGAEAIRCLGTTLFEDNYLHGGAEGLFIRNCADVTVRNNFITSPHGIGIMTRDATGTPASPNRVLNNVIHNDAATNAFAGISLVELALNFQVTGNVITGFPCGVQVPTAGATGIPTPAELVADNDLSALTPNETCDENFNPGGAGGNKEPHASFDFDCVQRDCTFTDTSTDPDAGGTITAWSWDFGDGTPLSTEQNPSHTFAAGGLKTVTLLVTDNHGGHGETARQITVFPLPNVAPNAQFSFNCTGLVCQFSDNSVDPDGSVASRSWNFGDGSPTKTSTNPTHTYATPGNRTVMLTVVDNEGKPGSISRQVITSAPGGTGIQLTLVATWIRSKNRGKVNLSWSGVPGTQAGLWRNGKVIKNIANDGEYTDLNLPRGTYRYKICKKNSTQCSEVKRVTF